MSNCVEYNKSKKKTIGQWVLNPPTEEEQRQMDELFVHKPCPVSQVKVYTNIRERDTSTSITKECTETTFYGFPKGTPDDKLTIIEGKRYWNITKEERDAIINKHLQEKARTFNSEESLHRFGITFQKPLIGPKTYFDSWIEDSAYQRMMENNPPVIETFPHEVMTKLYNESLQEEAKQAELLTSAASKIVPDNTSSSKCVSCNQPTDLVVNQRYRAGHYDPMPACKNCFKDAELMPTETIQPSVVTTTVDEQGQTTTTTTKPSEHKTDECYKCGAKVTEKKIDYNNRWYTIIPTCEPCNKKAEEENRIRRAMQIEHYKRLTQVHAHTVTQERNYPHLPFVTDPYAEQYKVGWNLTQMGKEWVDDKTVNTDDDKEDVIPLIYDRMEKASDEDDAKEKEEYNSNQSFNHVQTGNGLLSLVLQEKAMELEKEALEKKLKEFRASVRPESQVQDLVRQMQSINVTPVQEEPPEPVVQKGQVWQHYENKHHYEILAIARDTSSNDRIVVYKGLYEDSILKIPYGQVWTRSYRSFIEVLCLGEERVPRFTLLSYNDGACIRNKRSEQDLCVKCNFSTVWTVHELEQPGCHACFPGKWFHLTDRNKISRKDVYDELAKTKEQDLFDRKCYQINYQDFYHHVLVYPWWMRKDIVEDPTKEVIITDDMCQAYRPVGRTRRNAIIELLKSWKPTLKQTHHLDAMMRASLPFIYGEEWETLKTSVLQEEGLTSTWSEVVISNLGGYCMAMFIAAVLLKVPGIRIMVIRTGNRPAVEFIRKVSQFIKVSGNNNRVIRHTQYGLVLISQREPRTEETRSRLFSASSTSDALRGQSVDLLFVDSIIQKDSFYDVVAPLMLVDKTVLIVNKMAIQGTMAEDDDTIMPFPVTPVTSESYKRVLVIESSVPKETQTTDPCITMSDPVGGSVDADVATVNLIIQKDTK